MVGRWWDAQWLGYWLHVCWYLNAALGPGFNRGLEGWDAFDGQVVEELEER